MIKLTKINHNLNTDINIQSNIVIKNDGTIIFNKLKFEENAPIDFAIEFLRAIGQITGYDYEKQIKEMVNK